MQTSIITANQAREARESLGLSQGRVSKDTGVGRTYLSQFECSKMLLDDRQQQSLRDYFEGEGHEFDDLPEDDPAVPGLKGARIRDGFQIPDATDAEQAEEILSELVVNSARAHALLRQTAPSGFFGIDDQACSRECRKAMKLMARNWYLVEKLQGRDDLSWMEAEEGERATVGASVQRELVDVFDMPEIETQANHQRGRLTTTMG